MKEKRGAQTRLALIKAGLELFGERGVEATSTRMLSQKSGTNIAAINYHFGGKNELYSAVAEHICEAISQHMEPILTEMVAVDFDELGQHKAEHHCVELLSFMAKFFAEKDESYTAARIIMREQANPTEVFTIFYKNIMEPTQNTMDVLIAQATGQSPDSTNVKVQTHLFLGQVLGLRVARESFLRHLQKTKLSRHELTIIYGAIRMQVQAGLAAMRDKI